MAHIFTPALRRPLSKPFARSGTRTLIQRAIASLRARGSDAHLWLPGGDVRTYGPELVVNGGFADATGWANSSGTDWTFNTGVAVRTATAAANGFKTAMAHQAGKAYKVTFEIVSVTNAASGISAYIGDTPTGARSAVGTYTEVIVSDGVSPTELRFFPRGAGGFAGSIDNISVREITSITSTILNGLTTGNYLESTGNTLATVDNPTGLVLDALGTVGSELVTNGNPFAAGGWNAGTGCAITGGKAVFTAAAGFFSQTIAAGVPSTVLEFTVVVDSLTSGTLSIETDGNIGNDFNITAAGTYTFRRKHGGAGNIFYINSKVNPLTAVVSSVSLKVVTGIHAQQGTTANKGLLKQDAGSRYYWLFDATDLLTGTFPAGYESVTVIDAKSTGQVTTSAANVVGSYSIGPSYSSYGRIIIKGSITASELALYQGFANKLAGL